MKKKVLGKICVLLILVSVIGVMGCGSDEAAPSDTGSAEEAPASGTGVATEEYTADFNGHKYEFVPQDMTWEEARLECVKRGGHLVTVTSAEEEEYLKGLYLHINGDDRGGWLGAYSDGAYGGDKNDWCWVTGEKWNYTNWDNGEPSNSRGTEWFVHFWKDMTWNDVDNEDSRGSQYGYICEYDDLTDVSAGDEELEAQPLEGDEPESDEDWEAALEESVEEDPYYKDLGDGRTAIQSHWRGVQIKYPASYYADADDDALYVYDGDQMYVYVRNITTEAEGHSSDLSSYCASKVEDQAVRDFTKLFGAPQDSNNLQRLGGDGKNRVCELKGNMWNNNYDIWFKSQVLVSGKKNDFLILKTSFWRYDDKTGSDHYNKIKVTSWGKGDMYGQ
ncbi:MAG: C-type lectin domain-containing protein [Lachnospiraceae bacterium]|nr:C-type lectin domain-containing protein [Lachnospiraceae bacterium]